MARPPPFRLTRPVEREWPRHKQIADLLRLEIAPPGRVSSRGVCWWSIDVADYGGSAPGARMSRGVIAGQPDVFIGWLGQYYFIEIKADDGTLSDAQKSVASAVLASGGRIAVARDANDVLKCIDQWRIPRNGRTRIAA